MASNNQKPLTKKDLAEFTEEVMLPAVERIVDERVSKVDERVGKLDERVGKLDERVGKLDERVGKLDERVGKLEVKVNGMKLELMDFIDDKISDLRGDIVLLFRREDRRLLQLVKILFDKQVIDKEDIKILEEIPLFQKP